jgi:tetratricopeptide (TPR) repeat protein
MKKIEILLILKMKNKMKNIITYLVLIFTFVANAQEKDKNLPKGNDAFQDKQYADAEMDYRISQSNYKKKASSAYNLGNAIYKQNQSSEAKYQFAKAIKNAKTRPEKHQAFHNLGNCLMNEKDYSGAVEAYKNALRNNPDDEQTRYNYALAKKMLKENPPKDGGGKDKDKDKDKKDDKDKNKDKEKQDQKDKPKDDKGDQNKPKDGDKDKDKKEDQNKGDNPQKQPTGVNKQRLESLLDAMNNEEKKVQEKVNLQKVKSNPNKPEKDW